MDNTRTPVFERLTLQVAPDAELLLPEGKEYPTLIGYGKMLYGSLSAAEFEEFVGWNHEIIHFLVQFSTGPASLAHFRWLVKLS